MDIISHGLWGGIAFGRKNERYFLWAFLFGIMPDLLSFGVFSFMRILGLASGPDWSKGLPDMSEIPGYVHAMYNITHSLFVFAFVFGLVLLVTKKIFWPMLAWLLHILMDIPTHSMRFFATPFLWPFSDYKLDGVGWGHPYIFFPNIALLVILYSFFVYSKRKENLMASKEDKHIFDSYNTGAKKYYENWCRPHDFTEVDRCKFCELLPPNGRVLDIGCGPGNDTTCFIENGFSVVGVDLSKEMIGIASGRETRAVFHEMDMRHLTFDSNSFDGIWASFSFLHIKKPDAQKTLQQFKRVLRNGGYVCLLIHTNVTTVYKKTQISGLFEDDGEPISTYVQEWKQEDLLELLKKTGFEPCIIRPFTRKGGSYPLLSITARMIK